MSYNNKETIYADGMFLKEIETKYGTMMKIKMKVDEMIDFLERNKDENGFVTVETKKRREPSKVGNTHYAVLDTYKTEGKEKPTGNTNTGYYGALSNTQKAKPEQRPSVTPTLGDDDDLPF